MIGFIVAAATDVGRVRSINQDGALTSARLVAVADGMGGHQAGEVASELALEALRDRVGSVAASTPVVTDLDDLRSAVREANLAVHDRALAETSLRGMGTTLCVVVLLGDGRVGVANVGDSRVYLFREGELHQLTDDHSLVQELVRGGQLTPEDAEHHPQRNIVTRALGVELDVAIDAWDDKAAEVGDRYLLCSDGLFNEVSESAIAATLGRTAEPSEAVRELVELANQAGGHDNITCVVADITGDGEVPPDEVDTELFTSGPGAVTLGGEGGDTGVHPVVPLGLVDEVPTDRHRSPRLTWRVLAFVLGLLAVSAVAFGAVAWFARNTYFVGVDDEHVVIYRGRPDGVLWFEPTIVENPDLPVSDLTAAEVDRVSRNPTSGDLSGAREVVARLETDVAARSDDTTAGSTSTTGP